MKKIYLVLLLCLFASCLFAKGKTNPNAGSVQIMDYQGAESGEEIPSWVPVLATTGDYKEIAKILNINREDTCMWVSSDRFETDDDLYKWLYYDEELSIKYGLKDLVIDNLEYQNIIINEKKLDDIIAEYRLPRITIHSSFWTYNRKPKENISNPKKDSDFNYFYCGYKVITMPREKYDNFFITILNEYETR